MMPYEKLKAWQLCDELTMAVYRETRSFPSDERYGLTSQSRRSAFSAAVNIAEGAAKRGPAEFRRFLDMSIGSLAELCYTLRVAKGLGYLSTEAWTDLERLRSSAGRVTWLLYRSIRDAKPAAGRLTR